MLWPIQELARVYAEMQQAIAGGERIFSLLDTRPDISDRDTAVVPGTLKAPIRFEHVDFEYRKGEPVLMDFDLEVAPGEMIALVGATGAGKSTIVNLLCRFYDPTRGCIRIGGRDIRVVSASCIGPARSGWIVWLSSSSSTGSSFVIRIW